MRNVRLIAAFALLVAAVAPPAFSQEAYPVKPIRLVVAIGPGASADALARFLAADPLRRQLGTEIIVENRAGAGGRLGAEYIAKSKPDGYTLGLFHASLLSTATVVNRNVPYDPVKDFTPVATLVTTPLVIVVSADAKWADIDQFLREAKSGKIDCGLIGLGSQTHFNIELLKQASGAELNLVPYPAGTGAIITALMGKHLDCTSLTWPGVAAHVKSGKFRALAATSPVKEMPGIPTFASRGMPQVSLEVFNAVLGPAGLPRPVMERLESAFRRVMTDPKIIEQLENQGFSMLYEDSQTLAARIKRELAVVQDVFKKAGLKPAD
jgi:tripartite-type tricarboxylate transporter receptor subunit TctC